MGKLLREQMCTPKVDSWWNPISACAVSERHADQLTLGSAGSASSTAARSFFISRMQVDKRPPSLISSSMPLSQSRSLLNDGSARDVVVDRRWSWSSVTESDELVGRMSFVSRFPQYLCGSVSELSPRRVQTSG